MLLRWLSSRSEEVDQKVEGPSTTNVGWGEENGTLAGKVGLQNLGNTCFMNAGLQCLSHIEPLTQFFLSGRYKEEVNTLNPLGSKGDLSRAFAQLQLELWQTKAKVCAPRSLHRRLKSIAPFLFENYEQQDVQEFFACILDSLHEDLNRVAKKPAARTEAEEKADEELAVRRGDEFAAALAWLRYLERGKSFLVDLLQGQLRSSLTCTQCGHSSRCFDPFLYLSLPVNKKMTRVVTALEKYLEEEYLTGDERWFCEKCKRKVEARKKIDIWMLPPVLVLHLKRFEFDARSFRFRKIDALLSAPLTLDLSEYCSAQQKDGSLYNVVCIANHIGPYGCGHYTATCRVGNAQQGCWYYYDDAKVQSLVAGQDIVGREAYVIFLVRCSTMASAGGDGVDDRPSSGRSTLKRQTVSMPELWPHWVASRKSVRKDLELIASGGPSALQSLSFSKVPSKDCDAPVLECWLVKRGPTAEYGWRWRWCVLVGSKVSYYSDLECLAKKGEISILSSARAVSFADPAAPGEAAVHQKEKPYGFVLDVDRGTGKDRRLHYFAAESQDMMRSWIQAITLTARGCAGGIPDGEARINALPRSQPSRMGGAGSRAMSSKSTRVLV